MPRTTIGDLEERIGELEVSLEMAQLERDDWQGTAATRARELEAERDRRTVAESRVRWLEGRIEYHDESVRLWVRFLESHASQLVELVGPEAGGDG